jgi:hypothetical protein
MKPIWLVLSLALLLYVAGCGVANNSQAAGTDSADNNQLPFDASAKKGILPTQSLLPAEVTVPAGTPISVRLQNAVSSATAGVGDSFDAVLDEPLVVNEQTVVPRGAAARGRVEAVRRSGRLHNSGYLRIALTSVVADGKAMPIHTSSIFVAGGSHKNRDLALIGGGAGGGALIGALAGGGKGALIGSLVGAGAGTGAAYATGKKDVGFGVERRLTFRLTQPLVARR